jgi:hypothetical protein
MDGQLCALTILLTIIAIGVVTSGCGARGGSRSGFYTEYSSESPTRPYGVPYTGTEPRGAWGAAPWGATALSMLPTLCE